MVIKMSERIIELNSKNLLYNLDFYKKKTTKDIIAIVKDNAYGHGLKEIISIIDNTEIKMYAVANIEEAIEASNYTQKDILILDKVNDFSKITDQMIITIISKSHLTNMIKSKYHFRVHLKINTGMNRKGILPKEFDECMTLIKAAKNINLEGIYTHYASNKKSDLNKQYETFKTVVKQLDKNNYLIHASSSVSSLLLKENLTNACRIGIGLYGLNHRYEVMKEVRPVLSLYSHIDKCSEINKNTLVGYNYMFKTPSTGFLLLSPIGYGLGYLIRQKYQAFYKGIYLKQMCRVCMDCCIYFSKTPIKEGEKIELLGEHIPVDTIARNNKCSPYEIVTLLNKSIKRIVI
jgi:alanine racemase